MLKFFTHSNSKIKPDHEVNKWLPIILTLDKINVFYKGGRAKFSVHTQQKNELGPEMLPCLEVRGLMLLAFSQ
jgi:hypothetical protein